MTIRVGETGKRVYCVTSFNMAANTSLEIKAIPPSGEQNQQTWTATLETGPLTNITLEDGTTYSTVNANESMYYDLTSSDELNEAGDWTLVPVFYNTGASPNDKHIGDPSTLTVLDDNFDNSV